MIDTNELLYVVDEYDMPLEPKPRHETIKNGYWHRAVHVWIVNHKKEVLCQKRSLKKDISPGKWEAAIGGHIGPADNYFTGAVREVREETGLPVTPEDLSLVKIYKDHRFKEYRGIFYCRLDVDLHHIKKEEEEVDEVKLIHMRTLKKHLLNQKSDDWITQGYEHEVFSIINAENFQ